MMHVCALSISLAAIKAKTAPKAKPPIWATRQSRQPYFEDDVQPAAVQKRDGEERPEVLWVAPRRTRQYGIRVAQRDQRILHQHCIQDIARRAERDQEDKRIYREE
jgi:hypothetical protein